MIIVCVLARLAFVFCCALTTGGCYAFQHIFGNEKKSEFCGPYFQAMLFLVTMLKPILTEDSVWLHSFLQCSL